jgi:hypothetical protein
MNYQEGDIVRVRSWSGTWRVSSVMERPPLAYVREVGGVGKGYIEQKHLELIEQAKPEASNQLTIFQ